MSVRATKVYAEGRHAAYKGAAANTNPHTSGSHEYDMWAAGWTSYGTEAVSNTRDVCAEPKGGGFSLAVDSETLTLDAGNGTITATVTCNAVATENIALTAESSDTDVCTVAGDGDTDASGEVEFTVTQVGDGTATVTISTTLGTTASVAVTSENTP
jgi:hypothetical protein